MISYTMAVSFIPSSFRNEIDIAVGHRAMYVLKVCGWWWYVSVVRKNPNSMRKISSSMNNRIYSQLQMCGLLAEAAGEILTSVPDALTETPIEAVTVTLAAREAETLR